MKIKLIPTSHPDLDAIEIDSDEFFIGRLEEPFISFDPEITIELSRRHAKIFTVDGQVCITDLESLNGTTLNDLALGSRPLPLNDGDILEFAKQLAFRVELPPPVDQTEIGPDNDEKPDSLTLTPLNPSSGIDTLVITAFPFLISKENGIFASFSTDHPAESNLISRRHAYITAEDGVFSVIDLGSTNGTFINQNRLDQDTPQELSNGDTIAIAGNFFSYLVSLGPDAPEADDATVIRAPDEAGMTDQMDEPRTTFINEPSPFLDIFCDDAGEENSADSPPGPVNTDDPANVATDTGTAPAFSLLENLKRALQQFVPGKPGKKTFLLVLAAVVVMAGIMYMIFRADPSAELKALINKGQYHLAAESSREQLLADPDNETLQQLNRMAILITIVPEWLQYIDRDQHDAGREILATTRAASLNNPKLLACIDLLAWMTNLDQYLARKKEEPAIRIFHDEKKISDLLQAWSENEDENNRQLDIIVDDVAAFAPRREQLPDDIRALEHDHEYYLKAINALQAELLQQLDSGQISSLVPTIDAFEKKYPAVTGLDALKMDAYSFNALSAAINSQEFEKISEFQTAQTFKTPLFIEYSDKVLQEAKPNKQHEEQLANAEKAWRKGEAGKAIRILLPLADSLDGSLAQTRLEHYQTVLSEYSALEQSRGSTNYKSSLAQFKALLNLPEDQYFLDRLQQQPVDRDTEREKAQSYLAQAQKAWIQYKDNKGIDGLMRLDNSVSPEFIEQAGNLTRASEAVHRCLQIFVQLQVNIPTDIRQLAASIDNELDNQKKWLTDLELVLKPEVFNRKIELLSVAKDTQ